MDPRRARIFGTVAGGYERARPDYPDEAVAWLADRLGIVPGRSVLDLGAGTGKLTRKLVATGARVVAVEPDAAMRAELERVVHRVEALAGTAEALPLPDASIDAITCAQAFHWFNADRALAEMARVLRPGGGVGLVWNLRDESDSFQRQLTSIVGESDSSWNVDGFFVDAVARSPLFGDIARYVCAHEQLLPAAQLVERVSSMSAVAVLDDEDRQQVFDQVRALADDVEDPIRLAYTTEAYAFRSLLLEV